MRDLQTAFQGRRIALGAVVIGLLVFAARGASFGQEIPTGEASNPLLNTADSVCADVRTLMQQNTSPAAMTLGGGSIGSGQVIDGTFSNGDLGDMWSFVVQNATLASTVTVSLLDLSQSIPVEFTLYQGITRVNTTASYQPISPGETVTLPTTQNGIYTLTLRTRSTAAATLEQPVSYALRVDYQGSDDVSSALPALRDEITRQEFTAGRDFHYEDGRQRVTFAGGAEFVVNPGSLQSVATRPNAAGQMIFVGGGNLLVDPWAHTVSLIGGDLSVTGIVDEVERILYLENFGARVDLVSPLESAIREIIDSNGTRFATDWHEITGIWMLIDCMGIRFADGTTFFAPQGGTTQRRLSVFGAGNQTCAALALTAILRTGDESVFSHNGCILRSTIQPATEFTWQQSIFSARLLEGRQIALETRDFSMLPLEAPYADDAASAPFRVMMRAMDGRQVALAFDWMQLGGFALIGDSVQFDFLDTPRTSAVRDGSNLRSLEAIDDVIHMVDQGDEPRERLMFGAQEGYLEIVTPAGDPTFDGASFDARALPGTPGFQPSALNNVGGECYPANTVLSQANCPPSGQLNPANGNLWVVAVDARAYHPLDDLTLTRSYNSTLYQQDSPFGYGWTTEYLFDYNVSFDPALGSRLITAANADSETRFNYRVPLDLTWTSRGVVTVMTASGSRHTFIRRGVENGQEVYTTITMPTWRLTRSGETQTDWIRSEWQLELPDGLTYQYDRAGRLRGFGHPAHGHQVTINYPFSSALNGPGGLGGAAVVITDDADQRQLELIYDTNHHIVRSILRDLTTSPAGSDCSPENNCFATDYVYQDGHLVEVRDAAGLRAIYRYDTVGRLTAYDDPYAAGGQRRALRYADETSGAISAVYMPAPDEPLPDTITDEVAYPLVESLRIELTANERRAVVTDYHGAVQTFVYRLSAGDLMRPRDSYTLTAVTSPLAGADPFEASLIQYTWENGLLTAQPFRPLPQMSGRGRNAIEYTYDETGALTGVRGGLAGFSTEAAEIAAHGFFPAVIRFSDGSNISYNYDEMGDVIGVTDRSGATYRITRSDQGLPEQVVRENDGVFWEIAYIEDRSPGFIAQIVHRVNADDPGYRITYQYDGLGRVIQIDDDVLGFYTIEYTASVTQGTRATIITAPDGSITRTLYDARDRIVETTMLPNASAPDDAYLSRITYEYDPADPFGRLSAQIDWLIDLDNEEEIPVRTQFAYTPQPEITEFGDPTYIGGWRLTEINAGGRERFMVYDTLGRVRLYGDGARVQRYDYDVQGVRNPPPNPSENQNGLRIIEQEFFGGLLVARTEYLFDFAWQLTGVRRQQGNPLDPQNAAWTAEWRLSPATVTAVDSRLRLLQAPLLGIPVIAWEDYSVSGAGTIEIDRAVPDTILSQTNDLGAPVDFLGRPLMITQAVGESVETRGVAYCPQPEGRLTTFEAAVNAEAVCGQGQSITVDAYGRPLEIRDATGVRTFTYRVDAERGGLHVEISASGNAGGTSTWQLFYNAAGDLVESTDDAGNTHQYTYDTLGRLRRIFVAEMPEASYSFRYTPDGLLTEQIDDLGRGTRYDYNAQRQLIVRQNTSTGDAFSYLYDASERLTGIVSPSGAVTTYQYMDSVDPARVTAIISPIGRDEYRWDDAARTITHVDGAGNATEYSFDGLGLLTGILSPLGRTQTLDYDEAGRLTRWQTADAAASREYNLTYDAANGMVVVNGWDYMFDPSGALIGVQSPAGETTVWTLDAAGRLAQVTSGTGDDQQVTTIERMDHTPTLNVITPDGMTILSYDALFREINRTQGENQRVVTIQSIDGEGLVNVRVESPLETIHYTFSAGDDRQPRRVTVRTIGRRTTYTYDVEGRLSLIEADICISGEPFDPQSVELRTLRPSDQQACATLDAETWSRSIRILYEASGLPIRRIDEEDAVETFTYDSRGNLVSYQDADGRTVTYAYDALNRLIQLTTPSGEQLHFTYALDRVVGICESASAAGFDYSSCAEAGGILSSTDAQPIESSPVVTPDQTVERDALGRTSAIQVHGRRLVFSYDADGRGYTITDEQTGQALAVRLTAALLPEGITYYAGAGAAQASPVFEIAYFGQESGGELPFSITWANGDLLDFRVNRRGEALFIDLIGAETTLTIDYDASPQGTVRRYVISGDRENYTVILGYDQANNPLIMRVTDTNTGELVYQVSYGYSGTGQMLSETHAYEDGTTVAILYTYEDLDRLTARSVRVIPPENGDAWTTITRYEYDATGNVIAINAGDEVCAVFEYDSLNRLVGVTSGDLTTQYAYDTAGRLISTNDTDFVYEGDDLQPFAALTGDDTIFWNGLTGDLSTDAPLFSAGSSGVLPFIYGGRGQLLGIQDGGASEAPLWLFDPYRRLVDLAPPAAPDSSCSSTVRLASLPAYLPLFGDALWDTVNDLFFIGGRVYVPQMARYLQPDPDGVDAYGRRYEFTVDTVRPPLRLIGASDRSGLAALVAFDQLQGIESELSADVIARFAQPNPSGALNLAWDDALRHPAYGFRNTLEALLTLPAWLNSAYNLPGAQLDIRTGVLQVIDAPAPGQGGVDISNPILPAMSALPFAPVVPEAHANTLAQLLERRQFPTVTPSVYHSFHWRDNSMTGNLSFSVAVPQIGGFLTPSAVLDRLPRAFTTSAPTGTAVLPLLAELERLPAETLEGWMERVLAASLPTPPILPWEARDVWDGLGTGW